MEEIYQNSMAETDRDTDVWKVTNSRCQGVKEIVTTHAISGRVITYCTMITYAENERAVPPPPALSWHNHHAAAVLFDALWSGKRALPNSCYPTLRT